MNILKRILPRKISSLNRLLKPSQTKSYRYLGSQIPPPTFDELNEDLYWDNLHSSLGQDAVEKQTKQELLRAERRVFVLQPRMQFKSKARQSTTPELQLAESISLVETLQNWRVVDWHIVGVKHSHSNEIFGEGNQEILSKKIGASGADCLFLVIDHLTVSQTEALRRTLLGNDPKFAIYDRYKLVLEIFKRNARSEIAKLQIAMAEIPYIRHKYENLELYKNVEKKIKRELDHKLKTRHLQSADRRVRHQIPMVAVFGYTNVGKTSFIKAITNDSKLVPENKLFATLDITYHGVSLFNSSQNVLFADTIGFISDIPFNLVEAFKTSLQDALDADMYVHLVDVSHPDREAQERTVNEIISELGDPKKVANMLVVYNKCDKLPQDNFQMESNRFKISSKTGEGIELVRERIENSLMKQLGYIELYLVVPQGGQELAYLYKHAIIKELNENPDDLNNIVVCAMLNKGNALKFVNLFPNVTISKKINYLFDY